MIKIILTMLLLTSVIFAKNLHLESEYQNVWCDSESGKTEVVLNDKTRIDCLTPLYAVEVDFAKKWAECAGQALYYGIKTGKVSACLLIMEDPINDIRYLRRLEEISKRYRIEIFLISPNDIDSIDN